MPRGTGLALTRASSRVVPSAPGSDADTLKLFPRRKPPFGIVAPARPEPPEPADAAEGRPGAGSSLATAAWTIGDQIVSSGTNAAINFVAARRAGPDDFGAFAIAYTIFALLTGLSRAAATAPLGISYASASPSAFRSASRAASGTALVIGLVAGAALLAAGAASPGALGRCLVAMSMAMPALLVQDAWRYTFFARHQPVRAVVNDLVWAIVLAAGLGAPPLGGGNDLAGLILVWSGAAAVAALFGVAQTGTWPDPSRALDWLRGNRETSGFMTAEYVTVQGAQQTSTLLIGAVASPALVGALRGIQTLLAPTTNLAVALNSFAVPQFARHWDMPSRRRIRLAYAVSGLVVASSTAWAVAFLLLPGDFGRALLGDTWPATRDLLGLAAFQQAGPALAVGPAAVLYALGRTRLTFRINLAFAPALFVCPLLGLHLAGARGVVAGYIIAFWSTIPSWLLSMHRVSAAAETAKHAQQAGSGEGGLAAGRESGVSPRPEAVR